MNKVIRFSTLWLLLSVISGVSAEEPELNPEQAGSQMLRQGNVLIPESSQRLAADYGLRVHTSHVILAPDAVGTLPSAAGSSLPWGENPTSIRAVYDLPSTGGAGVIAIVDAYDDPHAAQDLAVFSNMFGLPTCGTANGCFRKVYAKGVVPAVNCGWAQETSLDIEWAHAMAPNAKIVLVEAASNSSTDLMQAVSVASSIVSPSGTGFGEVSMSWGMQEFPSEVSYDSYFQQRGVVYVASSGDVGGQRQYPAVSPRVVAAGGTTIHRNASGTFTGELLGAAVGVGRAPMKHALTIRTSSSPRSARVAALRTSALTPILILAWRSTIAHRARASPGGWCLAARVSQHPLWPGSSTLPATSTRAATSSSQLSTATWGRQTFATSS